ncbi:transcription factor IIIB 90 kDa subunit-like [Salarias fasciatus]|uniref:transcription factor IIIB 90 kDa subunit-like n=1 Tax=Salarias fasciatus TaxID=181472 RepID=UPI001176D3B6|nr:transcription factor IIIB 90 kDa subunit-like [Salarias fasciatus]
MLEKKKISSKINYDVLRDLNRGDRGDGGDAGDAAGGSAPRPPRARLRPRRRPRRRQRNRSTEADWEFAANTTMMGKRFRRLISAKSKRKNPDPPVESPVTMETAVMDVSSAGHTCQPEADCSSAPSRTPPPVEEEEEEEVEEVEEECVSALQLVGDYGCEAEEEEVF